MKNIYTSEFYNFKGIECVIDIYDNTLAAGGTPTELTLESGYQLSSDAGISDVIKGGIIKTEVSFSVHNVAGVLDTFLEDLRTSENRFLVEILVDSAVNWRGILLQDFGSIEDKLHGIIQLSAVDGTGLLKSEEVTNPNPSTNTINSFLQYIITGLSLLPTSELFGTNDVFINILTDWYNDEMESGKEPLDVSGIDDTGTGEDYFWQVWSSRTGYNGAEVIEIKPFNYEELIIQVLEHFNAVLKYSQGTWRIYQRDELISNTISFHTFKKSGVYISQASAVATFKTISSPNKKYRADGSFSYLPGLKRITCIYSANAINQFGLASLIPVTLSVDDTYTTRPVYTGTGNFLHISLSFTEVAKYIVSGGSMVSQNLIDGFIVAAYDITVQVGSYYLQSDGSWSLTPGTIEIYSSLLDSPNGIGVSISANYSARTEWELMTETLPVSGQVSIKVEFNRLIENDGWGYYHDLTGTNTHYATFANHEKHFMLFIVNNQEPEADVTMIADNTNTDYSLEDSLNDNLFGSSAVGSKGDLAIYDGADWIQDLNTSQRKWNKGSGSTKDQWFNELLVNEVMSSQKESPVIFSGSIYDRSESSLLESWQAVIFNFKGYTYRYVGNKITYDARLGQWTGDWFSISRTQIRNATKTSRTITRAINQHGININQVSPSINKVITKISNYLNLETGGLNTGNSNTVTSRLGLKTPTTLLPNDDPPSGFNIVQMEGTDLNTVSSTGAKKSLFRDVQIVYGFLYNQFAVEDSNELTSSDSWYVPSASDYGDLTTYLGGAGAAGGELKAKGLLYWLTPNTGALDSVGFNGRGAGLVDAAGFDELKETLYLWTSDSGTYVSIDYNSDNIVEDTKDQEEGLSIRLCRDADSSEVGSPDGTQMDDYIGNDGQHYHTVLIDDKVWIVENLAETKMRDGTLIPEVTSRFTDETDSARCSYSNDIDYSVTINKLKDISSDSDSFEGAGQRTNPIAHKNYADDESYAIVNGKPTKINSKYTDTLDSESWVDYVQELPVTGLDSNSVVHISWATRTDYTDYLAGSISAVPVTDGVEFECAETPTEDIDVIITVLKW